MNRLVARLNALREAGRPAMGLFLTNGFPDPASTLHILREMDRGGADFIELGMPFSDPLAEGLPIQRSSARALGHGVRMADAFAVARAFRAESDTPLLLMGYINPVLRYGLEAFCRDAAESGVDGLILPDLPPEESATYETVTAKYGLATVFLCAPNTPESRLKEIERRSTGFIYAVSVSGLTGQKLASTNPVSAYLKRVRETVSKPLLVGFGIRTHADAQPLLAHTDGFIVGSALIEEVEALWASDLTPEERLAAVRAFVHALKHGNPAP